MLTVQLGWLRKLGWLAGVLVGLALLLELYMRWPSGAELPQLQLAADTRHVVLLVHGSGGSNEPLFIEMERRFAQAYADDPRVAVIRLIWAPHDNRRRSFVHGHKLGAAIGRELAELPKLTDIRMIAHSAGAYFLDPVCEAYRTGTADREPAFVEMTFLDGIGIAGGWDYDWGYRNHGRCADFARSIYTNNDPAPGHNEPYDHAHNIDVTESLAGRDFDRPGHYYPIRYFLDHLDAAEMQPRRRAHSNLPRGAVVVAAD
jgi:hypothetical protein